VDLWPDCGQLFYQLRAQARLRWTLVFLVYTHTRERGNPLVCARNLFGPDRTFFAIVRDTRVDIEWRFTVGFLRDTFRGYLRWILVDPGVFLCRYTLGYYRCTFAMVVGQDLQIVSQCSLWHTHLLSNSALREALRLQFLIEAPVKWWSLFRHRPPCDVCGHRSIMREVYQR